MGIYNYVDVEVHVPASWPKDGEIDPLVPLEPRVWTEVKPWQVGWNADGWMVYPGELPEWLPAVLRDPNALDGEVRLTHRALVDAVGRALSAQGIACDANDWIDMLWRRRRIAERINDGKDYGEWWEGGKNSFVRRCLTEAFATTFQSVESSLGDCIGDCQWTRVVTLADLEATDWSRFTQEVPDWDQAPSDAHPLPTKTVSAADESDIRNVIEGMRRLLVVKGPFRYYIGSEHIRAVFSFD